MARSMRVWRGIDFEAVANYDQSMVSEFADYAQSIGRDELESSRNRYVAEAMGQGALTGLAVVGMTRGKPASKNLLSGLDLATSTAKRSFIAKPHVRSSANRISAEKWINQTVSQKEYSNMLMANSVFNQIQLRNQLIAEQISKGHAFEKHILHQGEFPGWIRTHKQLQIHIETILNSNNTKKLYIGKERTVYCNKDSHTVIIHNPHAADGGTVFQPPTSIEKFLEMRGWK